MMDDNRTRLPTNDAAPPHARICLQAFSQLSPQALYELLQLRSEVFVLEQRCLYQDIDGADISAMHLLVWQDEFLLGYGRILPPAAEQLTVRIGRIVIAPASRGGGHSRWLIKLLRSCSSQLWPHSQIELSAQTHLQKLYASCGFVTLSQPYDEDGISHIDMRWQA